MKLAVLFWFYKDADVCENRLRLLKKHNPDLKIFGLYGGEHARSRLFRSRLGKYLDDFYVSPYKSEGWKWMNGDLMLLEWYTSRGRDLDWDSIAIVQWDMLVFTSLSKLFGKMKTGEIFLSGLRTLSRPIENCWDWTRPDKSNRRNYLSYRKYVKEEYGYRGSPLCCLFILQILPRVFFDMYLSVKNRRVGMLEYKVPMYARIFGIPFFRKEVGVCWFEDPKTRPLNAWPVEIGERYVQKELSKRDGWRIFHPCFKKWNVD